MIYRQPHKNFELVSDYKPTGDQPEAIKELTTGIEKGEKAQILLGATGTGKTFTISNVIAKVNKPTLILSHNKTLAGQLYSEMKKFFPHNAVEYFVSYYDYYHQKHMFLLAIHTLKGTHQLTMRLMNCAIQQLVH